MFFDWVWNVWGLNGGGWQPIIFGGMVIQILFFIFNSMEEWLRPAISIPLIVLIICLLPIAHLTGLLSVVILVLCIGYTSISRCIKHLKVNSPKWLQVWRADTKLMLQEIKEKRLKAQVAEAEQRSLSPARMTDSADDRALSLTEGA